MARRKWSWTENQKDKANKVLSVANDMQPYWPLKEAVYDDSDSMFD